MEQPFDIDSDYIRARTTEVRLDDGTAIRVRPIVPGDRDELAAGLTRLSQESRYARFFRAIDKLSERDLTYLTEIDYHDHFAWVATTIEDPPVGLGVARYIRLAEEPAVAEASVVVVDDHQHRGIAKVLLELLSATALEHGITHFCGYVLPSNRKVLSAMFRGGATLAEDEEQGYIRIDVELPPATGLRDSAMYDLLRAAARGEVEVAGE